MDVFDGLEAALASHGATRPKLLAETGAAWLFEVEAAGGAAAILKLYKRGHAGNEEAGARLMAAWSREGPMIEILSADATAILMPKLSGPSLGDLARQGADDRACHLLAETAKRLHAHAPEVHALPAISDWFGALFDLRYDGSCPAPLRRDMLHAGAMARALLASTHRPCPLHGDLHHDNVILTDTGPIAFDAKGVVGDRAYELANALRNPKGLEAELRDLERLRLHLTRYAEALEVSRARLAVWTAAKCALSIAWRAKGVLVEDREADLLSLMLSEANDPGL